MNVSGRQLYTSLVRLLVTIQVLDADPGVVVQYVPESPSRAEKET